ncbi:MAG: ATP-grasp domain-containing protein [Gemmatimonadales bacterium]
MPGGFGPRLLLILPTTTYRAEAFVEAALRLEADLTVASEHDSAFSQSQPGRFLTLDFQDPNRAAQQVVAYAREYPLAAVFGVDDVTAVLAAHASRALNLAHNPVEAVEAAGDKYRQRSVLRAAGIPVPNFELYDAGMDVHSISRQLRYPCVIKPVALSASRGVMRANDPQEFTQAFARLRAILQRPDVSVGGGAAASVLVEDYVPGVEFALEGLLENGRLHVLALFDKPDPPEGPFFEETIYVTPSRFPSEVQAALVSCAEDAARALGLERGPVHVELRYNDRGPWLIELAARPIGGKCGQVLRFGLEASVSLEQVLLGRALGGYRDLPPRDERAVAVMMIPVPKAGVLQEVRGVEDALGVPLVTDVIITVHRGQALVPLPEESRYPGFIFARGDTPEAVELAVRDAHARLELRIREV